MDSYKREIEVCDVVPNDGNPREDFGDISALAATMATNGGQPFSPIIVVPDGSKYRLVDGERRWRAMVELGTERCDALVFMSMGDAEAAVAMMATDNSKALDKRERLRGFQSMLALGVDDEGVASVTGTDADTVRRVRRYARDLPEQATLDGLIAAAYDEFSDEERNQILEQCGRAWGDPQAEADRIRKRHEREARLAEIRAALPESVEISDGARPSEYGASRDGLVYVTRVSSEKAAEKFSKEWHENPELVAYEDGNAYAIYRKAGRDAISEREAREAEEKRIRDEHMAAYDEAFAEMLGFATLPWWKHQTPGGGMRQSRPAGKRPHLSDEIDNKRDESRTFEIVYADRHRTVMRDLIGFCEGEDPSLNEVCAWFLTKHNSHGLMGWSGAEVEGFYCKQFAWLYDLLLEDGYEPSDGAKAIRAMCKDAEEDGEG